MSYVYVKSEPGLYTVGFYDPKGKWNPESDHETSAAAGNRVIELNGGTRDLAVFDGCQIISEHDSITIRTSGGWLLWDAKIANMKSGLDFESALKTAIARLAAS